MPAVARIRYSCLLQLIEQLARFWYSQDMNAPQNKKLPKIVIERMITLVLGGFGLVAALAWNEAIQALFNKVFGSAGSLVAKFGYAVLITIIVVLVSFRLSRYIREDSPNPPKV